MSRFETRMRKVKRLLLALKKDRSVHFEEKLEDLILNARTVTFVMQKELSSKEGFSDWYEGKQSDFQRFKKFIDFRNIIEKHGDSVIQSERHRWNFKILGFDFKKNKVLFDEKKFDVTKPKIISEYFFGNSQEEDTEVIKILIEYVAFLDKLVAEAKSLFLTK